MLLDGFKPPLAALPEAFVLAEQFVICLQHLAAFPMSWSLALSWNFHGISWNLKTEH